jgi:ubiquinone/menaquinone biosynthesis C-methylase UbiE
MSKRKEQIILENLKKMFNLTFQKERSQSYRDIFRETYKDDYPEKANPDSFVTLTDLKIIAKNLNVGPGKTFIDLGCGRGGPGLWIAHETGANYIGIDFSESALEEAKRRASNIEINVEFEFQVENMYSLNLLDNSLDGAISIDVLSFLPDPFPAIKETARILHSKAYFIFTTWELKTLDIYKDYRPYLQNAGFETLSYEETPNWRERQQEVYQKTLDMKDVLLKDMGKYVASSYINEAKTYLPMLDNLRRILVIAIKS